jgi:putative transposase
MHYSQNEKFEIIKLVEQSDLGVGRTLKELKVNKTSFYNWYKDYQDKGYDGLNRRKNTTTPWNKINSADRDKVVEISLEKPAFSSREVAWHITDNYNYYISESSVYRILKENGLISVPSFRIMSASDKFYDQTTRVNQMWQTDFTYFKIYGWGWYYLSTILDDYSRYIVTWKLCSTMKAEDVTATLDEALLKIDLKEKPKLLSDNGSCYISNELADYMEDHQMKHVRGRPMHPQTQGKIERYHRTMKNVIKLDNYFSPGQLEQSMKEFVYFYNYERYHESIKNVTPAEVYYGHSEKKLKQRARIKTKTLRMRKKQNQKNNLN